MATIVPLSTHVHCFNDYNWRTSHAIHFLILPLPCFTFSFVCLSFFPRTSSLVDLLSRPMTTRSPSPPPNYIKHNANQAPDPSFDHHSNTNVGTIDLHDIQSHPNPRALTPYLTLPHLLSLTWLASPVISLLFVAFRLVESTASAQDSVQDAKSSLMTSCLAAQRAASAAASMPRYMAVSTNQGIVEAVNASIDASRQTMILW